ncbi:hypothetical protein RBSH_05176 [Rhodopirellula baltica SH28]|uniref:Uncharacterized protein n=1 Tax=Rhodopirellula baltica SH28 TaxID=993517 RepID=K5E173_RHOBT|nr:hypothetical protein RBSH_05176 [Rhodopirellula baltica SH28]
MTTKVATELIARLRKATGMPLLAAREALSQFPPDQQITMVEAAEQDGSGILRDPIEQDPVAGPIIETVLKAVSVRVREEHKQRMDDLRKTSPQMADFLSTGRGLCHRIWYDAKQLLESEHQISWRTPAEMNPQCAFD